MMDFISIPLTCAIVFAAIYGVFELFVRRRERLAIIEKLGEKMDPGAIQLKFRLPNFTNNFSFSALKAGALLAGVGLGLLVGFFINLGMLQSNMYVNEHWFRNDMIAVAYGASVLLFGGIGLIIAFILEMKISKKQNQE
ncbi:MAG: hypothetical protein PHG27_05600 [Massilibacteroides sp.]|nr:hypothetical protein [Massilibacteroides sp.]MDD3063713.1 hypothetical protein [Massilibacteroides sp.]MDD4115060.1 hypothetical protein [Massilibacteroides sp.]MDD4659680.1 hypothetical protein [Massilibacteroides sp.]